MAKIRVKYSQTQCTGCNWGDQDRGGKCTVRRRDEAAQRGSYIYSPKVTAVVVVETVEPTKRNDLADKPEGSMQPWF